MLEQTPTNKYKGNKTYMAIDILMYVLFVVYG